MKNLESQEIIFEVGEPDNGQRLDRLLSSHGLAKELGLTRSQIKQLIEKGQVSINGKVETRSSYQSKTKDEVRCDLSARGNQTEQEYDFALKICYEDEQLLVLDKPPGLTVHPGANTAGETLLNALMFYYQKSQKALPPIFTSVANSRGGIVHRLDKDTSGLLVVAKTLPALQSLAKQFAERTTKRRYEALVFSTPRGKRVISEQDSGIIDLPIGRDPLRRIAMGVGGLGQRHAVTEWRVQERFAYGTLLELSLKTGRTHQIRVHLNAIGSPVIGDRTYGDFSGLPLPLQRASEQFGRQALHAKFLGFIHPQSGEEMEFTSEIPKDLKDLIAKFSLRMTR